MIHVRTKKLLVISILLSSCICYISSSMEKKEAALPSLRSAAMSISSGKQPTSPGRDELSQPKRAITHPNLLTHEQLKFIFSPKHEHDMKSIIASRQLEVDIAGQKVNVFAAPKSHKDDAVRNLFKDPKNNIVGRFSDYLIERRGEAHTMAAAGADCATIPGFLLYYVNGDREVPVTYTTPGNLIYIAFAARYEDLPKELDDEPSISSHTSPAPATTPPAGTSLLNDKEKAKQRDKEEKESERKEIKKDKKGVESKQRKASDAKKAPLLETIQDSSREQKHKSVATIIPVSELKSSILVNMLNTTDRAIRLDEDAQNVYQLILSDNKRALYLGLLAGDEGIKYFAKFVKVIESNIASGPFSVEGKITHLCKYELWKTGKKEVKAKLPEGARIGEPERFHKLLMLWQTSKS